MKKAFLFLASLVAVCYGACAQVSSASFPWARIDRDASSLAGIDILPASGGVSAGWQRWMGGSNSSSSAFVASALVPLGKVAVRASFVSASSAEYELTDAFGTVTGTFTPSDRQFKAGVVIGGGQGLGLDAGLDHCSSSLASESSISATMFDAHLRYVSGSLSVAAGASSVGGGELTLPSSLDLAASYGLGLGDAAKLLVAAQGEYYFCGAMRLAAGARLSMANLTARIGYSHGGLTSDYLCIGAGYALGPLDLDLSFLTNGTLSAGVRYRL